MSHPMGGYRLPEGKALVLRTNRPGGYSQQGYQWPSRGAAPAGGAAGLHGLLWGHGSTSHLLYAGTPGGQFQVLEVDADGLQFMGRGKVKFSKATVLLTTNNPADAAAFINAHSPAEVPELRARFLRSPRIEARVWMLSAWASYVAWCVLWAAAGDLSPRKIIAAFPMAVFLSVLAHQPFWRLPNRAQACNWLPQPVTAAPAVTVDPMAALDAELEAIHGTDFAMADITKRQS